MRGDGIIYKRGNVWWVRYYKNGTPFSQSSNSSDERVARRLLRQKSAEVRTGTFVAPASERLSFEDLAEMLRNNYKIKGNRSGRTANQALQRLAKFFGGDRALDMTSPRIDSYVAARLDEKVSVSTIRYDLAILRRAFRVAKKAGQLASVPEVTMPAPAPARQGFLDPAEFEWLHAALPERLRDPIEFLYLTGWRVGELKSLEWRDVSLHDRTVRLRPENSKNKRTRTLKLVGELLEIVQRAHDGRRLDCAAVFHADGKPLGSFRRAWRSACRKAGVLGLLVHDLRRSGVRNMVRAGTPESVAMALSGHETRSVFARYNITSERDLDDAASKIDNYVSTHRRESAKVVVITPATGTDD